MLGPNGSGKSTALAVTAGLVTPDAGRVVLDGTGAHRRRPGRPGVRVAPHARRTALLGQEPLLFPHLDALENVAFGPRSAGTPRATARRDAQRWLDEVGVGELAGRRPSQLSGGQAQRVAVARALAARARAAAARRAAGGARRRRAAGAAADAAAGAGRPDRDRGHPRPARRPAARGPGGGARRTAGWSSRARARRCCRGRAARSRRGWPGSTWWPAPGGTAAWRRPTGCGCTGWSRESRRRAGEGAIATFRPAAVAVYRDPVDGSPRNAFEVTITEIEPLADLIRVHAGLAARGRHRPGGRRARPRGRARGDVLGEGDRGRRLPRGP